MKKVINPWFLILITAGAFADMIYSFLYKSLFNQITATLGFIVFASLLFAYFKQKHRKSVNEPLFYDT
jgi:hypothetical protein